MYRINWLDYGNFSVVYLSILSVLLICAVVRRHGIGSLGVWVATLPLIPVVVIVAFATFIELVLDVFLQGAPMSKYPELGWQGAFLGVAAIFTLASLAAFTAAERLKDQWSALLNKGGSRTGD
ncbi:hypothetical protein [Amycolatopsis sp. DG1A-15b]|uniref:hypothetical protein n=1 Tax=Amycolatopsis sp. DG1A-15b TaxID=3052846 RepID=UPI00255B99C6|nr:hypothetical protein [Amycolatopsis sp. DG1A-15b]WIX92588.1 hypothetical protein QRY02_19960 [Amycolatopsis sp. DG1A-15b]